MPWLTRFVDRFSSRRLGVHPRHVNMEFVVEKVVMGQVLLRVLRLSPVLYTQRSVIDVIQFRKVTNPFNSTLKILNFFIHICKQYIFTFVSDSCCII